MSNRKIVFITGSGRGMGVDTAKAALAAGHGVVATGRAPSRVSRALVQSKDLLIVELDVTRSSAALSAVRAAVDRFGRIDVLVKASRWSSSPSEQERRAPRMGLHEDLALVARDDELERKPQDAELPTRHARDGERARVAVGSQSL